MKADSDVVLFPYRNLGELLTQNVASGGIYRESHEYVDHVHVCNGGDPLALRRLTLVANAKGCRATSSSCGL